jgi:hypothetical protein
MPLTASIHSRIDITTVNHEAAYLAIMVDELQTVLQMDQDASR